MEQWKKDAIGIISILFRGYRMVGFHDINEHEREVTEFLAPFESLGMNPYFTYNALHDSHLPAEKIEYLRSTYYPNLSDEEINEKADFAIECNEPFRGMGGDELRAELEKIRLEHLD